jgi:hypothetical protein
MPKILLPILLLVAVVIVGSGGDINAQPAPRDYTLSIYRFFIYQGEDLLGGGTAFMCDKGLVTAAHCVEPLDMPGVYARVVDVRGQGGLVVAWSVEDGDVDIAYLVLDEVPASWVPMPTASYDPEPHARVCVIGCYGRPGFGYADAGLLALGEGWVASVDEGVMLHNAPLYKGMSGSPTFDERGRVIGVACFVTDYSGWCESGSYLWPRDPEPEPEVADPDCPDGT